MFGRRGLGVMGFEEVLLGRTSTHTHTIHMTKRLSVCVLVLIFKALAEIHRDRQRAASLQRF